MEEIYYITFREARMLLASRGGKVKLNPDLRKTNRVLEVEIKDDGGALFPDGTLVERNLLEKIARDDGTVYFVSNGGGCIKRQ